MTLSPAILIRKIKFWIKDRREARTHKVFNSRQCPYCETPTAKIADGATPGKFTETNCTLCGRTWWVDYIAKRWYDTPF